MRADRLLSILMLLQTRGRLTAQDLAEQLEVSERTIYRDLDALGMAGIPVYAERGPGGGYSLVDGYQTRLTGLTSAEIRALFLSPSIGPTIDLGMSHALDDALLKLSASLPQEARVHIEQAQQRIYIDSPRTPHSERIDALLSCVQDAVWNDYRLSLVYQHDTMSRERKQYLVDAYGLVTKASRWYLIGASNGTIHTFSVEHILLIERTTEVFERPADFDLATYWTRYVNCMNASRNNHNYHNYHNYRNSHQSGTKKKRPPANSSTATHKKNSFCFSKKENRLLLKEKKRYKKTKKGNWPLALVCTYVFVRNNSLLCH